MRIAIVDDLAAERSLLRERLEQKLHKSGVGLRSVSHIAERSGGTSAFTYENGVFRAKIMMRAERGI